MSAPRIGKLIARVQNQDLYFNGEVWSGESPYHEILNEIRYVWEYHHSHLEERARAGLREVLGETGWEIVSIEPDMSDPEAGIPPEGWVS